ncbi:MAG: HAMP domain-containing histidine kinase [Pirellulales bacterium]|nr:HAMP domain-containing histidine kinase [Pirellulales bacterium]
MKQGGSSKPRLRIARLADESLLSLGRADDSLAVRPPHWQAVAVRTLMEELLATHTEQLTRLRVWVTLDVPQSEFVLADRQLLSRALAQLLLNAAEAMPGGGGIEITSYKGIGHYEIEVADNGQGLTDDARHRAFEPQFTTKPGSAGLGLALVQRVAQAHGGSVSAMNCPDGGAAFTLRLPSQSRQAAA